MQKIAITLIAACIAIGMYSCKKTDDGISGKDLADKYAGNWIGKDSLFSYDGMGGYYLYDVVTASASFKKVSANEVLILGLPKVGDSLRASTGNKSLVVTWGSNDGYGDPIQMTFTYVRDGRFEFSQPGYSSDHGFIEQQ